MKVAKNYLARILAELVRKGEFTCIADNDNFAEAYDLYEQLRKDELVIRSKRKEADVTYYVYKKTTKAEKLFQKISHKK